MIYATRTILGASFITIESNSQEIHHSRDVGMRFDLLNSLPAVPLAVHTIAAGLLLAQAYFQKYSAMYMLPDTCIYTSTVVKAHRVNGYLTLASMSAMAIGGFELGRHGRFPGLRLFNFAFAVPWVVMIQQLYVSIKSRDWLYHQLVGNMIVRSCLAVPLARVFSARIQQSDQVSNAIGYYLGIGTASIIIGVWQGFDLLEYRRLCRSDSIDADGWHEGTVEVSAE
jgi:hypothetical protein